MQTLVIDYETYFDNEYSLKKMPTLAYIRDPRFLAHGAAVKEDRTKAFWVPGADLPAYFAEVPWRQVTTITHNSNFDETIRFERYGVSPLRRVDTLALCRALLCQDLDFDLDSISKMLGFGGKHEGGAALTATKGVRELSPKLEADLAKYAIIDAEREYEIYDLLYPLLPVDQQELLDMFIQMSTEGILEFNTAMATECRADIVLDRMQRLEAAGLRVHTDGKHKGKVPELSSREVFANMLRAKGVEPPLKLNDKGGEIYAFSKKDPEFIALLSDPEVAHLVQAKLTWSSNSAISRVDKLVNICSLEPKTLPVQLNFSGAHTHRPSGGGGINMQNLNRGSKLRLAIHAPKGHVLVVVDLSQIELRVNMWFARQQNIIDLLTPGEYVWSDNAVKWKGADLYRASAAKAYRVAVALVNDFQRQFHKVVQLGCGFGMGWRKFRATCAIGPMGVPPILISDAESILTIDTYRADHPYVKATWDWLGSTGISAMMGDRNIVRDPVVFEHEAILLPDGMRLLYPDLRYEDDNFKWGQNNYEHKIYGGILDENIVQALAQVICKQIMLRIKRELGNAAPIAHQVYDEIVMVCREAEALDVLREAIRIISEPIDWCPDLPIRAEGGFAFEYSK